MKGLIYGKKFQAAIVDFVIVILQLILIESTMKGQFIAFVSEKIVFLSVVCFVSFIFHLAIWWFLSGELLSPFLIFFLVMFIFSCGQTIGWATGIKIGKDLILRSDHGLNQNLLVKGIAYTMLSLSMFHLGAVIGSFRSGIMWKLKKWDNEQVIAAFKTLGNILLIICIPAFLAKMGQDVLAVTTGGYRNLYSVNSSRSTLMSIISFLSDYFQPCLLILLIAYRERKAVRRCIILLMLIDVAITLYIGGRSDAVLAVVGIVLAYHFFIRRFGAAGTIIGFGGAYIGAALLNAVAAVRGMVGRGVLVYLSAMTDSFSNVIGNFVGELGWSMTSLCWTMNLIPRMESFRYGLSYITGLFSWVPSILFGGKVHHPTVIWSNLANWLQSANHMSYGPGYTTVAESYINFGYFGILFMFIEGVIVAAFIAQIRRKESENNLLASTYQVMIIMVIMKALVRSSFSVAFRSFVFTLLPLFVLIYLCLRRLQR